MTPTLTRSDMTTPMTVSTVSLARPCGCAVGLLSELESVPEGQRLCAGTLGNPWVVIPCGEHRGVNKDHLRGAILSMRPPSKVKGEMPKIKISDASHVDHGLPPETLRYVLSVVEERAAPELWRGLTVIETVELPESYAPVPCALVGPATGFAPVTEDRVRYEPRPPREYPSRLVSHAAVLAREVSVIVGEHEGDPAVLYTAFGGPLAPREPGDPTLQEDQREASEAFWREHALADRVWIHASARRVLQQVQLTPGALVAAEKAANVIVGAMASVADALGFGRHRIGMIVDFTEPLVDGSSPDTLFYTVLVRDVTLSKRKNATRTQMNGYGETPAEAAREAIEAVMRQREYEPGSGL